MVLIERRRNGILENEDSFIDLKGISAGSHQRVLVDVGPLHLLGFGPGQHHGATQDVQVLLQDKHGPTHLFLITT